MRPRARGERGEVASRSQRGCSVGSNMRRRFSYLAFNLTHVLRGIEFGSVTRSSVSSVSTPLDGRHALLCRRRRPPSPPRLSLMACGGWYLALVFAALATAWKMKLPSRCQTAADGSRHNGTRLSAQDEAKQQTEVCAKTVMPLAGKCCEFKCGTRQEHGEAYM
ncbi:hypothetical protein F2P81_018401 [Scophthalmus maximus]|uniref:Transmembrane protein n=1 Tax=Scophthalmus maximus TaxID=52904 RepID=A0A6A4S260_SCOMX|nr:hypothetical protein F2P81_018401 [Scophthalmus maximus]